MKRSWWGLAVAAPAAVCTALLAVPAVSATAVTATPVNIVQNPGAEAAKGSADGSVVKVPDWTKNKGAKFTAVQYGASGGFPAATSPGPKDRGKNFFAGGPDSSGTHATQTDSLASYKKVIAAGASYTLQGWLGGYEDQTDHATVMVTWENASGTALGTAVIGPVGATARKNVTGLLERTAKGTVPANTAQALITIQMVRADGSYCDGYVDNISLTIVASS